MQALTLSQFYYCPLVWILVKRGLNKKTKYLHERALRIVYEDELSDFEKFLENDNTVTSHVGNLQLPLTEIFKTQPHQGMVKYLFLNHQ